MATRSARKVVSTSVTQQSSSSSSTSQAEVQNGSGTSSATRSAGRPARPSSPLSPTRLSRMQEKLELQNLNDRLAAYIDRVRYLENENSVLTQKVQSSQETITREVTSIKSMYEQELADTRKLLDDVANEKARALIDAEKYRTQAEELQNKFNKKDRDCAAAEKKLGSLESQVHDLQTRLNNSLSAQREAEGERDRLSKQLSITKSELEEQRLRYADAQNRNQSLQEELKFKESLYEKELSETRVVRQTEITEIDGRLKEQYEQKLSDTLKDLREQYESEMRRNRDEIEHLYEDKLGDLQDLLERNRSDSSEVREELQSYKSRVDVLSSKLSDLESQNTSLQSRIKDMERLLDQERDWHNKSIRAKDEEIARLREEIEQQLIDYQDLLDIKVALDLEIAAYRKLLEGEESRLNLTPAASPSLESQQAARATPVRRTPLRGVKRKRAFYSEREEQSSSDSQVSASAKGDVEISDHTQDGKSVTLYNKGDKDISLAGWHITRKSGDNEFTFKFHRSHTVKSKTSVTVWSSDSGATHSPPSDLVMKGQTWPKGDNITTILANNDGEEVATRETKKKQLSTLAERTSMLGGPFSDEHLFHQQGDPANPDRCSIM